MNPTNDVLEKRIAQLEGGVGALAVASGQAAETIGILNIAQNGDEIVSADNLYGGTYTLFENTFKRFGIKVKFVDSEDLDGFKKAITEKKEELLKPLKDFQKNVYNHTAFLIEKMEYLEESLTKKIEKWIEIQNENPFDHIEKIETEDGTMIYKYDFNFEIKDINQVPFQFLKIDEKAVESAIKGGIRNIPGLSIFETKKATFRVKNFENKVKNQSNYIDLEV